MSNKMGCSETKLESISAAVGPDPSGPRHSLGSKGVQQQQHQHQQNGHIVQIGTSETNRQIEKSLLEDKIKSMRTIKLLMLGGAESGKSTIAKQMKIIHMNGFTNTDYINYRFLIHSNVVHCLSSLLDAIDRFQIAISDTELRSSIEEFRLWTKDHPFNSIELSVESGKLIESIWLRHEVQTFYNNNEFHVPDSTSYFLENVSRIAATDYKPSHQDILRSRIATTGVYDIAFTFKNVNFQLIDVGGQRSERKKWIHCFDNVTAVIFVASLIEYDLISDDDNKTNRMRDSLQLFKEITHNNAFVNAAILLFLNKTDIFEDKLKKVPLKQFFETYAGANTFEATGDYIKQSYLQRRPQSKDAYTHFTNATDTQNVEVVFAASMDIVLKKNLSSVGVY